MNRRFCLLLDCAEIVTEFQQRQTVSTLIAKCSLPETNLERFSTMSCEGWACFLVLLQHLMQQLGQSHLMLPPSPFELQPRSNNSHPVSADSLKGAPLGAYLGCFDLSGVTVQNHEQAWQFNKSTISKCRAKCSDGMHSMAIVSTDYSCRCSLSIPPESSMLPDEQCQIGKSGSAVFYLHKYADTALCRISEVPMAPDSWSIAYGEDNVHFGKDGVLTIKLENTTGARLSNIDGNYLYGQFEITAKVSGAPGVVSAFYTRSSDVYPNTEAGEFSEIDFEFLNGHPADGPGGMWFNTFIDGQGNSDRLVHPDAYQEKLGWPADKRTDTDYITYTVNWQPNLLLWAFDGKPVYAIKQGQQTTWKGKGNKKYKAAVRPPNRPMHVVVSLWTDDRPYRKDSKKKFGGIINPSSGPYYSSFKHLRRIVCDKRMPAAVGSGWAGKGPSWLYAGI